MCCLKGDQLQFLNICSVSKLPYYVLYIYLLNCITETIQVTVGRKCLTRGPYVGQQWFQCFDGSISVLKYRAATLPIYDQISSYLYEQSPSWEAYSFSSTLQIPRTEWNPTHAKKN